MSCKRILFWFFVFDSEGNFESFSKQEMKIHKHVVLQLVNHGKYNQTLSIGQWEEYQKVLYCFFLFIYYQKKAVLCIKAFLKTALQFWKDVIKMIWKLKTWKPRFAEGNLFFNYYSKPLKFFAESSILDIWQESEYASAYPSL